MRVSTLLAASAVLFGLSSSAFATDMPHVFPTVTAPAAPEPIFTWTGVYVGGEAAYNWNAMPFTLTGWCDTTRGTIGNTSISFGPVAGIRDRINGSNIVVGAFGSYDFGSSKKDDTKFGNVWHADAQIGYAFDRFLPYVSAGVVGSSTTLVGSPKSIKIDRTGWSAGGGIDYALTNNIVAGVYGRYNDLGSAKSDLDRHTTVATSYHSEEVGARLLFKF